jgi:hypothetical protein
MTSQKVEFIECVISTAGRNLIFSIGCRIKISRFTRNDRPDDLQLLEKIRQSALADFRRNDGKGGCLTFYEFINFDDFAKNTNCEDQGKKWGL